MNLPAAAPAPLPFLAFLAFFPPAAAASAPAAAVALAAAAIGRGLRQYSVVVAMSHTCMDKLRWEVSIACVMGLYK